MDNPKRDSAVRLLQHYFRMVAQAAGNQWVGDHDAEIAAAVDFTIDAAADETMRRIEERDKDMMDRMYPPLKSRATSKRKKK